MKIKTLSLITFMATGACAFAQEIYTANHDEAETGPFNAGRAAISATLDGPGAPSQWNNRGNAGLTGDGRTISGFSRYRMDQRDLLPKLTAAGSITWTTGLYQKEKNREIDPDIGGHDVDVYIALDPAGTIVPSGDLPSYTSAWDWPNDFGFGYENSFKIGSIPQSYPMATDEEKDPESNSIPVDSPAMNITFDVTSIIKGWINDGLLTETSTIAFGLYQRGAQIIDEQGNPKFDDPNLYIHSQMVFEVGNAFLALSEGGPVGPGVFSEYELVGGTDVDSGDWLGWVYVAEYPWCYVYTLGKYIYVAEPAGWVYIPQ